MAGRRACELRRPATLANVYPGRTATKKAAQMAGTVSSTRLRETKKLIQGVTRLELRSYDRDGEVW